MKKFLALLVIAAMTLFGVSAFAYDVKVDDDTFAKVGAKAQVRFTLSMPDGLDNEADMALKQGRIYFAGQVTNMVKFGLNFDFTQAASSGRASDGFIMLDLDKSAKILTGVYRVAFSRIGLQDSYAYILPDGPAADLTVAPVASGGLATYRNAGVTLWGDLMDGKLRYNFGIWDNTYNPQATTNTSQDSYLKTLRVVLNLADPEKGYTCPGCYLGKGNVMSIGFGYLMQDYTNALGDKTYSAMTVDGFYENNGTTLEAAYFMADTDSGAATGTKPSSFYVQAAQVFGNWQPAARFESYDSDGVANTDYSLITAGVNYLFSGHDAKLQLSYSMRDTDGTGADADILIAQLQTQF